MADFCRSRFAVNFYCHAACVADCQSVDVKTFGQNDFGLDAKAFACNKLACHVNLEGAVAGVGVRAVVLLNAQKAVADDGNVRVNARGLQRALAEYSLCGGKLYAGALLDSYRSHCVFCGGSARQLEVLVNQVLKLGALLLVAGCVYV